MKHKNKIRTEIVIKAPSKIVWNILMDFAAYGEKVGPNTQRGFEEMNSALKTLAERK